MKTPHEPLTPEERALAQSLSRLGPHGGPSPGNSVSRTRE